MDGDFNFCKERRRDPFHGKSVRLRGARGCTWQMNDLPSQNPTILANNRSVKAIHSSTSSATYIPVTAVDMCSSLVNLRSSSTPVESRQVLGKREAWDEVLETLQEHAVSVRCSNYNKNRRTHDLLYELPIIGHMISTGDDDVSQSLHWPILNGKAYDPTCLYVSQGAALEAFGCGERHPLPVVLAPRSAGSSCNLCDELGEAFTDNSNAGRKSMPLLPINLGGAILWVAVDGRAIDKMDRNSRNAFAALMYDRCTYNPWSAYWSSARPSPCSSTAISRQAVEVFIDMPKPQAITHIGLLGQRAEIDFMQVNGCSSITNKRWRRRGRQSSSLLKTVVDPASLGWVTSFNLYCYNEIAAKWTCLGSYEANSNSFDEKLIDLKPHFNSSAALVTQRLKIVPTGSHGVFPKMRIVIYNGVQPHTAPSSTITLELSSVPSRPIGERACYGGKWFRNAGCRFCWSTKRHCSCKKMIFREDWGREVWELEREGCAKGHSVMISELDCGSSDDGGCKDVDEKCRGKDCTVADGIDDDDEDDVRYEASDAEGDVANLVLSGWEYVGADAVQADSFSISSFGVGSSRSSSSESDSSDMMSCDDTSSSGSDASMSSSISSISSISSSSIVSVSSSTSI